jgi:hypothetical protein
MKAIPLLTAMSMVGLLASGGAQPAVAASAPGMHRTAKTPTEATDKSGISLVGPNAIQAKPRTEAQAMAFDVALQFAMSNPDDMGYPWLDPKADAIQVRTLDPREASKVQAARADLVNGGTSVSVVDGVSSISELEDIKEAVNHLAADGAPNADLVWSAEPDQKNGRIIISVSSLDPDLMA